MSTIGSNIAALKSLHNLRLNEDGFAKATERLSSGKRLNSAGDDAAGAAIVNRMSSQIAGMNVASVTRTAKGKFDITFTTAHSTGNYTTIATAGNEDYSGTGASPRAVSVTTRTATTVSIVVERADDAVNEDNAYINVLVLG